MSSPIICGTSYFIGRTHMDFLLWQREFIRQNTMIFAKYLSENERAYKLWKAKNYDLLAKEFLDYCYKR